MAAAFDLTVTKPSRSDEILDPEQQLRIADQIRALFESTAPKRPTKPNRSEPDDAAPPLPLSQTPYTSAADSRSIPELEKLKSLESKSQLVLPGENGGLVEEEDEYNETEYYKELLSVDKQHHTTGTGFIKVAEADYSGVTGYNNDFLSKIENGGEGEMVVVVNSGFGCNPATNDWLPSIDDDMNQGVSRFASAKPTRSG
ncbi:hypothetical protein Dimus_017196 [Dionaea muscipula]